MNDCKSLPPTIVAGERGAEGLRGGTQQDQLPEPVAASLQDLVAQVEFESQVSKHFIIL